MTRSRHTPTLLVINPGSTSTKIAVYRGKTNQFETTKKHDRNAFAKLGGVIAQADAREKAIRKALSRNKTPLDAIDVFVGRGGLLRPLRGGVYAVNENMLEDLRTCRYGEHASNLGGLLAHRLAIAADTGAPAYIANPVVVDELMPVAKVSGHPDLPRKSIFHALNQKAVAEKAAKKLKTDYAKCTLVVAHVGGGVTVGAHRKGLVVEVNNGLEGEGPFSPERTGGLALMQFYAWARERKLSVQEAYTLVTRNAGLVAHLGTNDCEAIEKRIAGGDEHAKVVYDAFAFSVAKAIGGAAAALGGKVDAVVLTGEVLHGRRFRNQVRKRVKWIAPVHVFAGNAEMEALARAGLDAFHKNKSIRTY